LSSSFHSSIVTPLQARCIPDHFAQVDPCFKLILTVPQTPLSLAPVPPSLSQARCIPDHFAQVDPCFKFILTVPQTPLSLALVPSSLPQACCIPDHFAQVDPCFKTSVPQTPLSLASVSQSPTETRWIPDHFAQVDPCLNSNLTLSLTSSPVALIPSSSPHISTQTRPNSSLQFSYFSNTPLPSSKANVLNPQGISTLLRHYPNQRFVDTLVSIALNGITVGYTGSPTGQTRRPNHASTSVHPDVITKSIQSEIAANRVREITNLPANYFCSPLGLTPKLSNGI